MKSLFKFAALALSASLLFFSCATTKITENNGNLERRWVSGGAVLRFVRHWGGKERDYEALF
jgi:hypothetical protein